jgi:hypothetical protein
MTEKQSEIDNLISTLIYSLESDGFYHRKTMKYLFKMQKEVIWPIDNKSIYKIRLFVSKYKTHSLGGTKKSYSLFLNLVDDKNNTLIFSKSRHESKKEIKTWILNALVLSKEIIDVALFITKLSGTCKDSGMILRSEFPYGNLFYCTINTPIRLAFKIEKKCVFVFVNYGGWSNQERKMLRLSDVLSLEPEYIKNNYHKMFSK